MSKAQSLSGPWVIHCSYPTLNDEGEEESQYPAHAHQKGDALVVESEPRKDGSYMLVHLAVDGDVATGSWHESTQPEGEHKGMMYSGAGQLLISSDGKSMDGQWAGAGLDRKLGKPRIYTGRWRLVRPGLD